MYMQITVSVTYKLVVLDKADYAKKYKDRPCHPKFPIVTTCQSRQKWKELQWVDNLI